MVLATQLLGIIRSLKSSHTNEEIAEILDCDVDSVASCIKECDLLEDNSVKLGRPKVFNNRKLVEQLLIEYPHFTSIDIKQHLEANYGVKVSRRTLWRRIKEIRQTQQQPTAAVPALPANKLSAAARKRRLNWARAHQHWTVRDWRNIFNMDDRKHNNDEAPPRDIYVDTLIGPDAGDSHDLNLLEQLMDIIAPKIQTQAPQTVEQFRAVLYDAWHSDSELVDQIEQLYQTMTWRVAALLQCDGAEI